MPRPQYRRLEELNQHEIPRPPAFFEPLGYGDICVFTRRFGSEKAVGKLLLANGII
jgi:hypothetical protein